MGGIGSGSWHRWDSKPTVEGRLSLDVNRLARDGILAPWRSGTLYWSNVNTGQVVGSARYLVEVPDDDLRVLRLSYTLDGEPVELPIAVEATYPVFGGRRWWFRCPLITHGTPCGRRAAKLHLRGRYFGCRQCHGLVYYSSKTAHQRERALRQIDRLYARYCRGPVRTARP
jgi:hypothetical protein